jgi:hypothetical protein
VTTYTAQVGPDNAAALEAFGPYMTDIGEGTVQITDLAPLRALPEGADGSITEDEDGLQIWLDGEGYPLFGAVDAAVADALGKQVQWVEQKRLYDRATGLRDDAVRAVVDLAGSVDAAATLLEMDPAEVVAIVGVPVAETDAEPVTEAAAELGD